jgi:MFS family permease
VEYTCLIAGYMLSCWIDYAFYFLLPGNASWQGPYYIQMGLSFILFVVSFILPETPRWLARNGFMNESLQTIADLHSNGDIHAEHVQHVFLEVQEAVRYEITLGKSSWGVSSAIFSLIAVHELIQSLGNVHSLPQTYFSWYHCTNVRSTQRHQYHLVLPSILVGRSRIQ